jgi:uncharacterized protein (DUF427 family)
MKAVWQDTVIAESDETIVIEGNHYFPPDSIKMEYFQKDEEFTSVCPWKGVANYYHVKVGEEVNKQAAWTYRQPKEGSTKVAGGEFANYVAFWHGVEVVK